MRDLSIMNEGFWILPFLLINSHHELRITSIRRKTLIKDQKILMIISFLELNNFLIVSCYVNKFHSFQLFNL